MTAAAVVCGSCGTEVPPNSKFCNECGAPITPAATSAEYKQVTVLFADVVHSMDMAAAVGPERLREIMAELVNRATAVVQRYGGTVDKFTGDGIMAVFGAPTALEDHAFRACLAAVEIQDQTAKLAAGVKGRDGIDLKLRIGLNSGQVIAGELGSATAGYTAIGEQVGMAERMESAAPPGGVMLSESTARLVEHCTLLGEVGKVHIKGSDAPMTARRLLGVAPQPERTGSLQQGLVGRELEVTTITGLLDRSMSGRGCVVCVAGPAGIGKTRLAGEAVQLAKSQNVEVFSTFCESHATGIAFRVVARLGRAAAGVIGLDEADARARVREQVPDADPEDLMLFDDLLGIADPDVTLPRIDPDARRRRLTALVNAASLARTEPALYVIEDAHWIDEVSESMLAEFFTVIPQTPSMVLITYRPEYEGALTRIHGAQTIALAPLSDSESSALIAELLGPDSSVDELGEAIVARAAGNPFFAQEMVRDLAERAVLEGRSGSYVCHADVAEVGVPPTLQATIAARIDRLDGKAKRALSAAAVIGLGFDTELLSSLGVEPVVDELVRAELIDQVRFTPRAEYAFRHPLIRTVAYEAQLKSDRAQLHRRLADAIQERGPESLDANAALIAEHLEAAGDLRDAFAWHMRAGNWLTNRDIVAARTSWRRARQVADRLPDDEPDRKSMRIAPRTLLCVSAFRAGSGADTGFGELRDLCLAAGDQRSLALGMAGLMIAEDMNAHRREASRLATELVELSESVDDPTLAVTLLSIAVIAKVERAEMAEVLRLTERVVELTGGDPTESTFMGGSPLAFSIAARGVARLFLGAPGWKDDLRDAVAMARAFGPMAFTGVIFHTYIPPVVYGGLLPDETALADTAEALEMAQQSGDDLALDLARTARGVILVHRGGADRRAGLELLARIRERASKERFSLMALPIVDIHIATEMSRSGDVEGAVKLSRAVLDDLVESGWSIWCAMATTVLVDALLHRASERDLEDAQVAIDRLAAAPIDPELVLHEIILLRLRAMLARAQANERAYREYRDTYHKMSTDLGFEGHIEWAEAMP
jgi:adenylate cyclase